MGKRIKNKRRERGWGQKMLAAKIGVTCGTIGNWERDLTEPSILSLMCLADVFGVTIDWLVRGK